MARLCSFPRICFCRILVALLAVMAFVPAQAQFSTAKPDIKEYKLNSHILNQERKITIYKPPVLAKYREAVSPVLYVLDGELAAYYYCTMVNYLCQRLPAMPPITVVGIENEPSSITESGGFDFRGRSRDLTPLVAKDSSIYKTSGGAENFLKFINEEVFPFVEKDYKKAPYRVMAGLSLAGFLVMHTFLQHPDMFNGYIAVSPAMQMDKNAYMKIAEEALGKATERNHRLFFSVGNEPDPYIPNARRIDSLLKTKSLKGLSYQYTYYPKEGHATMKAMHDGFYYIFQVEPPEAGLPLSDISYSVFENHYRSLSKIFGYTMKPDENLINRYGYIFLNQLKDIDKALEFFRHNVENYPSSANAYDSYGEALLIKGDKKNALFNYEKAFQMDPTNTNAKQIIDELKLEK